MASCAQQVVAAIAARLAGNTSAGARVFTDRLYPVADDQLPDWRVYADGEAIGGGTVSFPRVQTHELTVRIAARVRAVSGMDAALDALAVQMAGQLFDTIAHKTLGGLVQSLNETGRAVHMPQPEQFELTKSDAAVGEFVSTVVASFITLENAPEAFA